MHRGFLSNCARPVFISGLVNALTEMGYQPVNRAGSHLKLRYVHPETSEVRNVTIPMGKKSAVTRSGISPLSVALRTSSGGVTGSMTFSEAVLNSPSVLSGSVDTTEQYRNRALTSRPLERE